MTAVDARPRKRWLSKLWRQHLAAATPTERLPEEAPTVGHIYLSDQPEPGEATTALGRHYSPGLLPPPEPEPEPDRSLDQQTQVIRWQKVIRAAADTALNPDVEITTPADDQAVDPPIYLRTLAEIRRLRALPPAVEDSDGEQTTTWATTDQPEEGENQ